MFQPKDKVLVIRLTEDQLNKVNKLKRKKFDDYHSPKENNSDVIRRLIDEAQLSKKNKKKY